MRQRTTWKQTPRSASTQRRADDLYTMNRDGGNPQPAVNEYENGDPPAWAEDVNSGSSVEKEYAGGAVKRNEIGQPEFRDDTWNHKGTKPWGGGGGYDNARLSAAQRKAAACERVARAILRTNDEKLIEDTALDLMNLPAKALVATVKRMDQTSPAALSENGRFRRALACTKLSALILSEQAEESAIERLATLFNSLDDSTLKSILNTVATSRVSAEPEKDETEGHEKGESKDFEKGEKEEEAEKGPKETSSAEKCSEEKEEQGEKEEKEEEDGVLTESDLEKLQAMMQEVVGGAPAEGEEGVENLEQLFEGGEGGEGGAEAAPGPGAPPVDITFDDGDDGEGEAAGKPMMAADLNGLFDTEENAAQRELRAAQEGNFSQRTASTKGAKKLGQVKVQKPASVESNLEALWERPGQ